MNILHYTVGLSEDRGGGLSKYVEDLAIQQSKDNDVSILYPGVYRIFNSSTSIKKEKNRGNIEVFAINNPLSLPMMFGLKDKDYITKKTPVSLWRDFLKKNKFDLIHLHTLMGLYEEFIFAAKELEIPIIYSTHDYFGLCPKQVYVYNNEICKNWHSCIDCAKCNRFAFSKPKIFIIHSKLFRKIRKNKIILKIKGKAKSKIEQTERNLERGELESLSFYKNLKNKYIRIFNLIDWIHFNSSISEWIFRREIPSIKGEIINISHMDIKDRRKIKIFNSDKLHLTYLGPATYLKGFNLLIKSLDNIYSKNKNFILNIYTPTSIERPYLVKHGDRYEYSQLEQIMDETDILIAPSLCYETFGFTVLEALSFGVPVIVSEYLGAKDLVNDGKNGFVINEVTLSDTISDILSNKECLRKMNINILNDDFKEFDRHCEQIYSMYDKLIIRKAS